MSKRTYGRDPRLDAFAAEVNSTLIGTGITVDVEDRYPESYSITVRSLPAKDFVRVLRRILEETGRAPAPSPAPEAAR